MKTLYIRNTSIALIVGMSLMSSALYADMNNKGTTGDQKSGMAQMSGMMHDMSGNMMSMSGDMGKGSLNAMQQKQMGERMREMSMMMDGMSGMMGKGMTMDAEQQKKITEMRKRMDAMHPSTVAPDASTNKATPHSHPRDAK